VRVTDRRKSNIQMDSYKYSINALINTNKVIVFIAL
jgi:hypothetical protein